MAPLRFFVARDSDNNNNNGGDDQGTGLTPSTVNLLISLLVLVLFGITLVGALLLLRQKRRSRQSDPPAYDESTNNRRLTITTSQNGRTESIYVYNEKRNLLENSSSPPPSAVPEIRITFPEEEDESGKRKSGRVVVVRIGETGGVGLEPCPDEDLPPYQSSDSGRFQSLDLERMGGLKEKEDSKRYS
ncbi:hypothetical protein VTN77DRAFT_5467 [Rasamsonia byssochlamydoides]|uniref:uncharacterized protein n=1 Tax=Rasamsonia byssochlamydoides TaxID=89139 RepID=UPI0037436A33